MRVKFAADPRIGGGVNKLRPGQVGPAPVRPLLLLGDTKSKQEAGKRAQSGLLKAEFTGHGSYFHKAPRLEFPALIKLFDVIGNSHAGLDDPAVLKDAAKRPQAPKCLKLKNKDLGTGGQLHKRRGVGDASFKGRPRFRIEAEKIFSGELIHAGIQLFPVVHQADRAIVISYL